MLKALSTPRNRTITYILLAVCCVFGGAAGVVGISDNLPGIILTFGAAVVLVLTFVHPWRTAKQFRRLLYASLIGFVVFTILHNVFEALSGKLAGGAFQSVLQGIDVASFLIAILICPPALAIGIIGTIVMSIRDSRRSTPGSNTVA